MQETRKKRIAFILTVLITVLLIPSPSFAKTYDDSADTITYTTGMEEEIRLDDDDFIDACKELTGKELVYVKFALPSSRYGTLYYDFDKKSNSDEISSTKKYYAEESPYLKKVVFLPEDDYEGTVTISYTGYNSAGDSYSGKVRITVGEDDVNDMAEDLFYVVDSDETLDFDEDDFNDMCEDLRNKNLDYVKFTLPPSYAGTLYFKYTSKDNYYSKVADAAKYYYEESPSISDITFVPDPDYEGTVSIKYDGYDVKGGDYKGKIKIDVREGAGSSKGIDYSIDSDEVLDFDEDDFNDMCEDLNGKELDFVNFTLPSPSQGTLYYSYDDGDYDSKVSASKDYYYDDTPKLSKITFVPDKSFSGVCKIKFKGYDIKHNSFEGTVEITVGGGSLRSADVISYTAKAGTSVYFKEDDFNNVCKKLMNQSLDYVKFTLPSAFGSGKLYYGYTASGNNTEVSSSAKYYYGSTPFILNIAYVPAANAAGTSTIEYTGYDTEGSAYKGTVKVTVSGTGTVPVILKKSKHFKDVDEAYSWAVDYIDNLYTAGIVAGTAVDGTTKHFNPESKITRGEFMLMLFRALDLQAGTSSGNFSDVAKGSYYYDAIAAAKALDIAQGSENKFYPNASITREDTMVLALRAMKKSGKTVASGDIGILSAYSDNYVIDSYAREPIAALIKAGIITGSDDHKIHPMENITRAEAAAIIYRIKY